MSFLEILSVHLYKQIILFLLETYIKHLEQSLKKNSSFFFSTTDHGDEVKNLFDLPNYHTSQRSLLRSNLSEENPARRL